MNYRDLKKELMMGWDSGDRWGSAMRMFFDVAEEMYRREHPIPPRWQFRPGAFGVPEIEPGTDAEFLHHHAEDGDLYRLGMALERLTTKLARKGENY